MILESNREVLMQRVKIKWFDSKDPAKGNINQIYSNGLEFAVSTMEKQCSHFVYCKDFLHDAVWAVLYNSPIEIYRFIYDPILNPIDVNDLTRVLVGNQSDQHFHQKIPNCLDFLNQVEKALKLKKTVAFECEDPPEDYLPGGIFMLQGSQRWMCAPPMLSMYTMLMRCGFVHEIGTHYMTTLERIAGGELKPYQENDQEFVKQSLPGIKAIMSLGYRKIFFKDMKKNYPSKIDVMTLHHRCGIRAYSWGETGKTVAYWSRPKLLKLLSQMGIVIANLWEKPVHGDSSEGIPADISPSEAPQNGLFTSRPFPVSKDMKTALKIKSSDYFNQPVPEDANDCIEELKIYSTPYKKTNWDW